MSEKELWQLIRRNVPGHLLRIENLIGAGIPDCHLTHKGKQVWLELKIGKGNNVQFQNSQIAFFAEAKKHSSTCKVLMRKNDLLYLINSEVIINSVYKSIKGDRVSININELSNAWIWGMPWNWKEIVQRIYE
jgi:hypothetical protein